ncbi:hypothetical protein C0995_001899 [Termitomyces sp. Mi166|nr:hypothetical protein C0995_001899 [Termitomyces sp. Mi166\
MIEPSSEVSFDLEKKLDSHEHSTAECIVNSENTLDVETCTTPLSCLPILETSHSAVAKHLPGLPTCNELLNDGDGRSKEPEPEFANIDLKELNVETPSAPMIPSLSNNAVFVRSPPSQNYDKAVKADERHVPTQGDLTLQSSLSENLPFREGAEPMEFEEVIIRNQKSALNNHDSSTKFKLPLFNLEYKFPSNKCKIEDDNAYQTGVTLPKKRKHTHTIDSHRKLISPFRSPALALHPNPMGLKSSVPELSLAHVSTSASAEQMMMTKLTQPLSDDLTSKLKHRTRRASAPFKSPLSSDAITKLITVRMTPTIQALERKLQLLKRATKIKEEEEEETLLQLVKKWTEAGRHIAWEVWDLVKDNVSSEDRRWSSSEWQDSRIPAFKDSWGWDGETNRQEKERNWGWDVEPERMDRNAYENEVLETSIGDNDDKPQDTLGTMLIQLGIAPDTLGWNEDDEEFQDT